MAEHTTVFITGTAPGVGTRTYTESGKKTSMDVNSLTANTEYIATAEYERPDGVTIQTVQGVTFRTLIAGTFSTTNEQWVNNNDGLTSTVTFNFTSTYAISSIILQDNGVQGSPQYQCSISGNTGTATLPYYSPGTQHAMAFLMTDIYAETASIGRILTVQASTMETPFWVKVNSLYPSNVTYISFYENNNQIQFEYSTDMVNWTSTTSVTVSSSSKTYIRSTSARSTAMMMYNRNVPVDAGGNIMSLLTPNSATWINPQSLSAGAFLQTFYGDQSYNRYCRIMDAHELILPNLQTLPDNCFDSLFAGNTELTAAPTLPKPETIGKRCFAEMFRKTGIRDINDELTAKNLGEYAYYEMFHSCSNLRNTPKIKHFKSSPYCCMEMFYHCNNLSEITCLARDISATGCMKYWVSGVAASGTFYKSSNMSSWPTGDSGIPSGWTIRNYSN